MSHLILCEYLVHMYFKDKLQDKQIDVWCTCKWWYTVIYKNYHILYKRTTFILVKYIRYYIIIYSFLTYKTIIK